MDTGDGLDTLRVSTLVFEVGLAAMPRSTNSLLVTGRYLRAFCTGSGALEGLLWEMPPPAGSHVAPAPPCLRTGVAGLYPSG